MACYIFDAAGELASATIEALGVRGVGVRGVGVRGSGTAEKRELMLEKHLKALGKTRRQAIKVVPFSISRHGTEFGLIARSPEDPSDAEDHWWVEAQPGNYMAFYPPWEGEYDT